MKKTLLSIALFLCFVAIAREPNITISLTKYRCAIGDKIDGEVKVITDLNSKVEFEIEKIEDDKIVIDNYKSEEKKLPENMKLTSLTFSIQLFKLGEIKVGKVLVKVNGKVYQKEIPEINVASILNESKKDINPLKPQGSIKPDYSYLKKYFKYGLLILISMFLFYFLIKKLMERFKKGEKEVEEKPEILEPPCVEVKKLTSTLLSKTYLKEGKVKEFFVELSEIAKRFLGRVFEFDYDSKTTEDILGLIKTKVEIEEERWIRDFFEVCDLVKFAKFIPEQSETNTNVNLLYQIVDSICKRIETNNQGEKDVQV